MDRFAETADILANTTLTEGQTEEVVAKLFPVTAEMSERQVRNAQKNREDFMVCVFAPDLMKFKGTAYQVLQAASDYATHREPGRKTITYQERNFSSVLDGNVIIDTTFLELLARAKKSV
jgi:hypothetical protein